MCQRGMGHVERRDEAVRTLPEPRVVVLTVSDGVREGVDVVSGSVVGGTGEVREAVAKAIVVLGKEAAGKAGAVLKAVAPVADTAGPAVRGGEPKEERSGEPDGEVLLERIYEILTNPGFSDKPDDLAAALARILNVKLPAGGNHPAQDAVFVARLKAAIFRVAEANGMDEETAVAAGLLMDFMK